MRRLALALAALAAAIAIGLRQTPHRAPPPPFRALAEGASILTQWVGPQSFNVVLLNHGDSGKWALVDAGLPDTRTRQRGAELAAAVRAALPEGDTLSAILSERDAGRGCRVQQRQQQQQRGRRGRGAGAARRLPAPPPRGPPAVTHAHPDHIGGLPALLAAYPDAKVVVHEDERKFLVAGDAAAAEYAPEGSVKTAVTRWMGIVADHPIKVGWAPWVGGIARIPPSRMTACTAARLPPTPTHPPARARLRCRRSACTCWRARWTTWKRWALRTLCGFTLPGTPLGMLCTSARTEG